MICHMYMIHTLQAFVNAFVKKHNITERLTVNAKNIPINTELLNYYHTLVYALQKPFEIAKRKHHRRGIIARMELYSFGIPHFFVY